MQHPLAGTLHFTTVDPILNENYVYRRECITGDFIFRYHDRIGVLHNFSYTRSDEKSFALWQFLKQNNPHQLWLTLAIDKHCQTRNTDSILALFDF